MSDEAMSDQFSADVDQASQRSAGMSPGKAASYWTKQIAVALKEQRAYWTEAQKVIDAYRNGRHGGSSGKKQRYNVLYGNVETMRGALYAKSGKPDIRPRWSSGDPLAKQGSEILERGLSVTIDDRAYEVAHETGVLMACLTGRAIMRRDVETVMGEQPMEMPPADPMMADPMAIPGMMPPEPIMVPVVQDQRIIRTLVDLSDFLHSPAKCWSEVWWVGFRHRMTREDMDQARFKDASVVPLVYKPDRGDGKPLDEADDDVDRAEVWEIWSKIHKQRFWIVVDQPAALRIDDDPLKLKEFWPMQEPLQLVPTIGGTMLPQLDWWQYNQLAGDLEEANNRISALTKQLKFRGVRDQTIKELEKLASAPDNTFVAIKDYQQFVQKGGLSKAFEVLPIKELSDVLVQTIAAADQIEAKIDRLTGIADIMRGDSDAGETATAQQIKAQYGGIRIKMRQSAVQAWVRDGLRIDAELLAEQFDASILAAMSGLEVSDELMAMLKDDKLRSFRIDIESDSTVFEDGESQKQANAEIINTIVPLMEKGVMAAAQAPELTEVIFEVMALALRSMKGGRAMEDVLDRAKQSMQQRMQMQAQQAANPQPDPAIAQDKENRALDREERMMDHEMKQSDASRQEQAAEVEHQRELERMGAKAEFEAMKPRKGGSLQ